MALTTTRRARAEAPLYENDLYSWAIHQAGALRERRTERLDWNYLAEEVEDLARRNADALRSHFESLTEHLLKLAYASPAAKGNNLRLWRLGIRNSRRRIRDLLKSNPGLQTRCAEFFTHGWPYARDAALGALNLDDERIPEAPLWTIDQVLRDDFEPDIRSGQNHAR